MSELVERLRGYGHLITDQAANALEAKGAEIERLEKLYDIAVADRVRMHTENAKLQAVVDAAKCKKSPGGLHRWNGDGQCLACTEYATDTLDALITALEVDDD